MECIVYVTVFSQNTQASELTPTERQRPDQLAQDLRRRLATEEEIGSPKFDVFRRDFNARSPQIIYNLPI